MYARNQRFTVLLAILATGFLSSCGKDGPRPILTPNVGGGLGGGGACIVSQNGVIQSTVVGLSFNGQATVQGSYLYFQNMQVSGGGIVEPTGVQQPNSVFKSNMSGDRIRMTFNSLGGQTGGGFGGFGGGAYGSVNVTGQLQLGGMITQYIATLAGLNNPWGNQNPFGGLNQPLQTAQVCVTSVATQTFGGWGGSGGVYVDLYVTGGGDIQGDFYLGLGNQTGGSFVGGFGGYTEPPFVRF